MKFKPLGAILTRLAMGSAVLGPLVAAHADGLIAYTSYRDGNEEVFVMNADGTAPTRLTFDPGHDGDVRLSPNGEYVVFRHYGVGDERDASNIYRVNVDGSGLKALTFDGRSYAPTFTPDGSKIGYWDYVDGICHFQLMNLDGTEKISLNNEILENLGNVNYRAVFSPNGTQIAFNKGEHGGSSGTIGIPLCVVNVDGSGFKELTPSNVYSLKPEWSRDGSRIAFGRGSIQGSDPFTVYTINADGSDEESLGLARSSTGPSYSPDGKGLAFSSFDNSTEQIGVANVDGSEQHLITQDLTYSYGPSWSIGHITPTVSSLSISDAQITEGDDKNREALFTVTLDGTGPTTRSVKFKAVGNTAVEGEDFLPTSGTLIFASGETSKTISVPVIGDSLDEADETFSVQLFDASNAVITDDTGIGTILDNDPLPRVRAKDISLIEGSDRTFQADFVLELSQPSGQSVTVACQTETGGAPKASAGKDYTALPLTSFSFSPGQTRQTVSVALVGDRLPERNEQFALRLKSAEHATIADAVALATILDDDSTPFLSVEDAAVVEGDSGKVSLAFNVTLTAASSKTVTVQYSTAKGDLNPATPPSDFGTVSSQTLTFAPGQKTARALVPVHPDKNFEADETLRLVLSKPVNALLSRVSAVGTILNDDSPTITATASVATEGDGNETQPSGLECVFHLSAPSTLPVTLQFRTKKGVYPSATAGVDYTAMPLTALTFAPGETRKTISVPIMGDLQVEGDETFIVNMVSAENGVVGTRNLLCTIKDDDFYPELSVLDTDVLEGDGGQKNARFTVTLSKPSTKQVTVHYETSDGTATMSHDFNVTYGTLIFEPGELSKTVDVPLIGDKIVEPDETFKLLIAASTEANIADGVGVCKIINDDKPGDDISTQAVNAPTAPSGGSS